MKQLITLAVLCLMAFQVKAQVLKITNSSQCTVQYYLSASAPGCSPTTSSIIYSIAPGASIAHFFSSTTWSGPTPGAGWQWMFIKEWNACGTYVSASLDCSTGLNQNVCAVGVPCSGLTLTSCMVIDMTCNTCQAVKTQWTTFPTGDVQVQIW